MLAQSGGEVGRLIRLGQYLNGEGFAMWEHAFVLLPGNMILEAEPGGAVIVPQHHSEVYWCTNIYKLLQPPTPDAELMTVAEDLRGTPYSFLDYFALAAHRLNIPAPFLKKVRPDFQARDLLSASRRLLLAARRTDLHGQALAWVRHAGITVQPGHGIAGSLAVLEEL